MYSLSTIEKIQRESIMRSRAAGRILYQAQHDQDEGVFSCPAAPKKVRGFTRINTYFVDSSGWGAEDEPELPNTTRRVAAQKRMHA